MEPKFFDTHSHVSFPQFGADRDEVLKRMCDESVGAITVGVDYESSKKAVELAEKNEHMYATLGLHPTDKKQERFDPTLYEDLVGSAKLVAIGECGLEYYRIDNSELEINKEKKRQKEDFIKQIEFALKNDKPLMLHCRPSKGTMDAYEDVLAILDSYFKTHSSKLRGNVHFFVGDVDIARQFLDLGFTLSFTGVITFARDYDDVLRYLPLDMVLSETDCPFVAPEPYRGKRNEPTYVIEVVKCMAKIRDEDFDEVRKQLVANACRVFALA